MPEPAKKSERNRDPFLQRAVEHWMDEMNELSYQPVFCQMLLNQGCALKYSIKNTHFEMGKDVVAVDSEGVPCAFQLKGGDINLKRWRDEVKKEIEVLIEAAIQHPDIDKETPHKSFLVTNGEIADNVRAEIVALNEKKWKHTPLVYWTRGDLLNAFQEMSDGILPESATEYKDLIELIFSDGTGLPTIEKVHSFLAKILKIKDDSVTKAQRSRDIAAAILYTSMIVGPYISVKNHVAAIQIQTILLSLVLFVVDKYSLDDKYWLTSYEIVWSNLVSSAKELELEVGEGALDNLDHEAFEIDLVPLRKHAAASTVYAYKLSQLLSDDDGWKTFLDPVVIKKYEGAMALWGEASLLPLIYLGIIWNTDDSAKQKAKSIIKSATQQVIDANGRKPKMETPLMPPYWDIDTAVDVAFVVEDKDMDKIYRSSYYIQTLVDLLVIMGARSELEEVWKEISFIHAEKFICDDVNDFYLHRISSGKNLTEKFQKTSSWSVMEQKVVDIDLNNLPKSLIRFKEFIPFFCLVYPHRLNSVIAKSLVN